MTSGDSDSEPLFLIIGARGQIGFELARELAAIGRVATSGRPEFDFTRPSSVRACVRNVRPDVIVNAAAYTDVDRAESERSLCHLVNADGPRLLAEEAARIGAALVHYSTDYVFDGTKIGAYGESDPPNPLNVYGESKLAGEIGVAAVGGPHLVLRTAWVYGSRGYNFMQAVLRMAREREELRIVVDQLGSPTPSRTVASVTRQVLAALGRRNSSLKRAIAESSGLYHLTANGATTRFEFAEAIATADPLRHEQRLQRLVPIKSSDYPTPARRPLNSQLDTTKLSRTFSVECPPWRQALTDALTYDGLRR